MGNQTEALQGIELPMKLLGVTEKWIYQRTYRDEIPYYKVGGLLRFRESELIAWRDRCQRGQR